MKELRKIKVPSGGFKRKYKKKIQSIKIEKQNQSQSLFHTEAFGTIHESVYRSESYSAGPR